MTAINWTLEIYSLFLDFSQIKQGYHLKSSTIGEDVSFPIHELVQPTHFRNEFRTRPQAQVISVSQNDLTAEIMDLTKMVAATLVVRTCCEVKPLMVP